MKKNKKINKKSNIFLFGKKEDGDSVTFRISGSEYELDNFVKVLGDRGILPSAEKTDGLKVVTIKVATKYFTYLIYSIKKIFEGKKKKHPFIRIAECFEKQNL